MSSDEELDERRREAREKFLSNLRTIGITGDEATDMADTIDAAVANAVQGLIDRKS